MVSIMMQTVIYRCRFQALVNFVIMNTFDEDHIRYKTKKGGKICIIREKTGKYL